MATIITKNSSTASSVPAAGSLQQGELAVNVTDKKLYTKDSSAAVVKLVGSLGNQEANAVAITGGTINGTAIGGTTPAAAAFTTASASGGFTGNLTGNASTVTNGVYITGSYADPAWITSLAGSKITGNISGNAANVTGTVAIANGGTGLTALGTGVQTALGQTVTGSGGIVLAASPSLTTPNLGTPSAVTLTNATGLPVSTGISGLGTNVATALGVSVGSVGSVVVNGGALGTPSSGTLTNATGLPLSTGVTGTLAVANGGTGITAFGSGVATALGVNVGSAGAFVVNGGALGTPSSGTVTNLTGTASININGTVGATTPNTGSFTTLTTSSTVTINGGTANGVAYLNGSKVFTTGSALVFNGTQLGVNASPSQAFDVTADAASIAAFRSVGSGGNDKRLLITSGGDNIRLDSANQSGGAASMAFSIGSTEQMRLTSTGLGIGTSSPAQKLDVAGVGAKISDGTYTGYLGKGSTFASVGGGAASDFAVRSDNALVFATGGPFLRATLDSSGNLGLGVTPESWFSTERVMRIGLGAGFGGRTSTASELNLYANAYINTSGSATYIANGTATRYAQDTGKHLWYTAASGTAGNAISFTQAMTLDASGRLGIGVTSPGYRIDVDSGATATTAKLNSTSTTAYSATSYNGGSARMLMYGGSATNSFTGIQFTHGGSFEALFGAVQNSSGLADFVFQGYNGSAYTERARITSGGVLDIGTGAGAVGQIQFPATQVASSNANTLDDYEEGTWTATLTDGTNTTTSDGATYRKIGSLVFISFQFYNKNISAWNAANLSVTGLPFTVATNHDSFVTANTPNGFTVSGPLAMLFSNSSTSSGLYYRGGSSNWAGVQKGDITNNSNFSLYLSACYTAS